MRDYGKVFSRIWASEDFRSLTEDGRTLALYLLTCEHGTISGVFRLPDGYASEDLQWTSQRVRKGFDDLSAKGFATRCEVTQWVWIFKFMEFNPPENPNQVKSATKQAGQVPDKCSWLAAFIGKWGEFLGISDRQVPTVSEPFRNPSETVRKPVAVAVAVDVSTSLRSVEPAQAKTARAARKCPETWQITDELRRWAAEKSSLSGSELAEETESFRDYTFKASVSDWDGAWRNWIRKAEKFRAKPRAGLTGETAYQRSMREKYETIAPAIAAKAPGALMKPVVFDFEAIDATTTTPACLG